MVDMTTITSFMARQHDDDNNVDGLLLQQAIELVRQSGILNTLCQEVYNNNSDNKINNYDFNTYDYDVTTTTSVTIMQEQDYRYLQQSTSIMLEEEVTTGSGIDWISVILSGLCLICASFCAGLILGILSLDSLMLHIKIRAGNENDVDMKYAQILLPLVEQRHLVLVSLLLLNFLADEALPLFLDKLFTSSIIAVIVSVFLVVFVSEIIPSAIFIGPDQLRLAALVSPFAKIVIIIMYPIAYPISKLLDWLLHDEDEIGIQFNRGELSALVRIQYEARMAAKRRELKERRKEGTTNTSTINNNNNGGGANSVSDHPVLEYNNKFDDLVSESSLPVSIQINKHPDNETIVTTEVNVLEGALALKTTTVRDVCTLLRKAYTIPDDMILDQSNVARIYGVGYSRVPVYHRNPRRPRETNRIIGLFMTRQLILVEPQHKRTVKSLPLYKPVCVSPNANMVEMLHIFQSGSTGHMALVCEKHDIATNALQQSKPIPPEANVIGIITLEDVIEELLQEPIYDEGDRLERQAMERAQWAYQKWRLFVKRKKKQREIVLLSLSESPHYSDIIHNSIDNNDEYDDNHHHHHHHDSDDFIENNNNNAELTPLVGHHKTYYTV